MGIRITALLAVSLMMARMSVAADWRQFRGNDVSAISNDGKFPTKVADESIAWTAELPGRGASGPIVVKNRVYVTASSGYSQDRLHVLCFDCLTGKQLWERQFWATGRTMCHPKMAVATPTPASDGERIFAFYSSNDLICLDLEGNPQWIRGLTHDYPNASNSLGMASSPIVANGVLIVQVENDSESFACGLDVKTGANKWKIDRPILANWTTAAILSGKTPDETTVLLQSGKGLTAIRPESGIQVWEYREGCGTIPSCAVSGDTVFVPSKGRLVAMRYEGEGSSPKILWESNRLNPATPSPIVNQKQVLTVGSSGVLSCGSIEDGKPLWQHRLEGTFSATPLVANGHLYSVNEKGVFSIVKLGAESAETLGTLDLKEPILGTPAASNGAIYVRGDGHLWKIAEK